MSPALLRLTRVVAVHQWQGGQIVGVAVDTHVACIPGLWCTALTTLGNASLHKNHQQEHDADSVCMVLEVMGRSWWTLAAGHQAPLLALLRP